MTPSIETFYYPVKAAWRSSPIKGNIGDRMQPWRTPVSIPDCSEILLACSMWYFGLSYLALIIAFSISEMHLQRRALQIQSLLEISTAFSKSIKKNRWSEDINSAHCCTMMRRVFTVFLLQRENLCDYSDQDFFILLTVVGFRIYTRSRFFWSVVSENGPLI